MPLNWTADGDFAGVVDTLDSVTLHRVACPGETENVAALRLSETALDPVGHDGAILRADATWQLPVEPSPGDRLVDASGGCWTVRTTNRLRSSTRFVCDTRRVRFAPGAAERFDLERPNVEAGVIVGWDTVRPALLGRVINGIVYFLEPIPAAVGDRLRSHRGDEHSVAAVNEPASIGDPYTVEVT